MKSIGVVNFSSKPGSVELQEIDRPIAGDDDVIMQVEAVSVCGSDLHQWHGSNSWVVNYPVVLGHEFCGVIAELGKNVKASGKWKEGDRVVTETAAVIDADLPSLVKGESASITAAVSVTTRSPSFHLPPAFTFFSNLDDNSTKLMS